MERRFMATLVAGAALLVVTTATLSAQSDAGSMNFGVQFYLGDEESLTPLTWRMYTEPREFQFRLYFTNESTAPIRIDQPRLRSAFVFQVNRGGEIPVTVEWLDQVNIGDDVPELVNPSDAVQIDPGELVLWTVIVRRVDAQPFTTGEYRITRGFHNLREAVKTSDGDTWSGRVPNGIGEWAIRVAGGATPMARARHHILVGAEAQRVRQFDSALESYKRAAAEDPTDGTAILGMASTYLRMSRYREAIPLYEAVLARPRAARNELTPLLAQAYVGAGEDAKAIKLLESSGRSTAQVSAELADMRRHAANNPGH